MVFSGCRLDYDPTHTPESFVAAVTSCMSRLRNIFVAKLPGTGPTDPAPSFLENCSHACPQGLSRPHGMGLSDCLTHVAAL